MKSAGENADSREKKLLICCARTRVAPDTAEKIRELAAEPLDWDYLLYEAEENSITPLLAKHLAEFAPDAAPAAANERLKKTCRANTVRNLYLTADLIRVLELFREKGIEAASYKGPVLAAQAYGDVGLREFEDVDVVLRQRDLPGAHEVILSLGYKPKFDWILSPGASAALVPGEYNYRDIERRAMVELHTERTLRHFPVPPNLDEFFQHTIQIEVAGREVPTFAPEYLLPMLCIHGSKDFWERFSWMADVAELIQACPTMDWNKTLAVADSVHAGRILRLGLALATTVLGARLPANIATAVEADTVAQGLAAEILARHMRRKFQTLDAAGRLHYRRRMVAGFSEGWRYALRLSVVPAEEDWLMMRLPSALAPLYIALRPLRLMRKYGWARRTAAKPVTKPAA
ncbi:MAG TPA: nucleotidyltransferase family protein [Candidatus Acidoferrales bacterium]